MSGAIGVSDLGGDGDGYGEWEWVNDEMEDSRYTVCDRTRFARVHTMAGGRVRFRLSTSGELIGQSAAGPSKEDNST